MTNGVVKVYQFRLKAGVEPEHFLAASKTVDDLLSGVDGFLFRSVARVAWDDIWQDIIYWRDVAAAENAGALLHEPEFLAIRPLIEMNDIRASQADVISEVYPDVMTRQAS